MKNENDRPPLCAFNILLADDDKDDCQFFQEALEELPLATKLTMVHDGEQLIQLLKKNSDTFFDVIFLDLNMPRKNGFDCLREIKQDLKFESIPVIILTTSYDKLIADRLYKNGAQHYICKPADFLQLKETIHRALTLIMDKTIGQPTQENFFISDLKPMPF